jgi:hypothetical protein
VLSTAIGRPVVAPDASREEYGAVLESQGRPSFIVEMGKGLYDASAVGEWADTTPPDVVQLLGHPLTSATEYIQREFAPAK